MISKELLEKADEYAAARLSERRYAHTLRVTETAGELAALHGVDPDRARLAALLHDAAREQEDLMRLAGELGIEAGEPEREKPILLHGPVAAGLARRELGVEDESVLEAIRAHTTGAPGMDPLALVLYVADKIEPGRDYPEMARLRALAREDLRSAARETLRAIVSKNESRGRSTHPQSIETLRWLQEAPDGGVDE